MSKWGFRVIRMELESSVRRTSKMMKAGEEGEEVEEVEEGGSPSYGAAAS